RPDAGRPAGLAAGDLRLEARDQGRQGRRHPRDRRRTADAERCPAGGGDHRPAAEHAALRLAAEHHEGQEEADRRQGPRGLRRRRLAAFEGAEGRRTAQALGRRQGRRCGRTGRQAQVRRGSVMAVLVIADHDNAHVRDTTHKTVSAARELGGDIDILVAGEGARAAADQAAKIDGVRKVLLAESPELGKAVAEALEAVVMELADGYDAIVSPATSSGKNFAPRIAARLDVAPISDIVEVVSADTFTRPIYAGNALETVQTSDAKKVITVRPTAFKAAGEGGGATVETIKGAEAPGTDFVSEEMVKSDRP